MKVQFNGHTFLVSWEYKNNCRHIHRGKEYNRDFTICHIRDISDFNYQIGWTGITLRLPTDTPNRVRGREASLEDAMACACFDHLTRIVFWKEYFYQCNTRRSEDTLKRIRCGIIDKIADLLE